MISRAGKNNFHNGITTPVNYTGTNDAFVLDGQRLMLINGTNGAAGSVYGTEQESFSKIEAIGGNGDSPDWFKVITKNGTIFEYGSDNSKLKTNDGTQIIFWILRKVTDASGNYMLYSYDIDNTNRYFSLKDIAYAANTTAGALPFYKVTFTYTAKTDYQSSPVYLSGSNLYNAKILERIDVKKTDETQIRSYTFSYQYRQKKYFLTGVTEAGSDGTALNPITFTYGENTAAADVTLSTEFGYATDRNYTGDFDGDGRTDIQTYAYRLDPGNGETWYRWYQIYDYNVDEIGGKYLYNIETDITDAYVKVLGKDAVQNPFSVSDFDGDGKEDVLLAKFDKSNNYFKGININYTRVETGWNPEDKYFSYKKMAYDNLPTSFYGQHRLWKTGGSFFTSGDFDGDGHMDYLLILGIPGYSNAFKAFLSTPSKHVFNQEILNFGQGVNGASGDFAANAIAESKMIIPINFDGDGKTELLVVRNEGSYVISVFPVSATTGYNYATSVLNFTPDVKTDYKIFPGDFNGDGNTDLFVRPSKTGYGTPWKIFLSTGKSFTQSTFLWAYTIILPGDGFSNSHMISVGDFDGDGKSDIRHSLDITSSSSNHVVYYSNGTSFTHEINGLSQSSNSELMYSGGDFNGDGKPDLMKVRKVSNSNFPVKFLMAKPFKEQNLLVGASNLGHLTSFDYALLNGKDNSNPPVYSRSGGGYSYNDAYDPAPYTPEYLVPAPAMYVLSKISRPTGIGNLANERFNYQDLIIHPGGRGVLGFKLTESYNDMNVASRSWNELNTDYSLLYPDVSQVYLKTDGLFIRSRYTTSFKQISVSSFLNRRFFIRTDRVHTKNWLTNEAEEILNTYDDYGNITETTVKKGSSNDFNITNILETATSTTTFDIFAGAPYKGFPISTTVQNVRTGKPLVSRTTNYTYTAQGLPETVTENAGTAIAITVTNTYNDFGLVKKVLTSAPGVATPIIEYEYDSKGLFVKEKKISGGAITKKETATYDDKWQAPLTQTSTDGLVTTYQYDNFGGLKQTNFPDGNSVVSTKSWETSGNARFNVKTQRTDGSNPVKNYIDILGREIKTEKLGYNNQWLTSIKSYNYDGQLSNETAPYYPGEPINNTAYYYDSYGRPTSVTNTIGTITTGYNSTDGKTYTVQTSNNAGQWTSKITDASGKVISSGDIGVYMNFTYDSWGNQLTADSDEQVFVTNSYDNFGRKQSTTDLNAGIISYEYNSIGQITKQTDAKGQIQTTSYDIFGRVSATGGPQGTTTYTYYYDVGSQKSNDNVTQITGFGGDVRSYQYDNLQRLSSETMSLAGRSLSKTYTYDTRGNLATTTYPAGFLIRNIYDNNDILTQTKFEEGSTVKTLFTATAMNSRGIYTSFSTGNGKTNAVTYDFSKEAITRYYTPGIQDLNLTFQTNTQNLLSRNDAIKNITETFTYDAYDRLTTAKVNNVQQFEMSYDDGAQGKILQKTDIGNYNYDAQKIHQLKYLTPISGGTDPQTVIGTNTRNIAYTAFLKTQSITENGYEMTYTYGSDRQRLTSTLKQSGAILETKTYWGNMELLTKGSVSSEIYYIDAGNRLNNIIIKKSGVINVYYTYTDQLGSIVAVTNEAGTIVAEQNFDAWGRYRNPTNWTYVGIPASPDWLYRGFTSHEHLPQFALINMNGRMYDPMTGMMLSPDNYVPMAWSPAGYNRYGYANGNPLKFVDPDGNFFWFPIIAGALIGGVIQALKPNATLSKIIGGALIGAAAGFVGAGVGNLAAGGSFFGNAAAQTVGFWAGAGSGAAGGAAGGFVGSAGAAWLGGSSFGNGLWAGVKGAAIGGVVGGLANGITSEVRKTNIEKAGKVIEKSDAFLKKAQETWYPKAEMNRVREFTVENTSPDALEVFSRGASGATIAEITPDGLYSGYSSVYFNPNRAFSSMKALYFTMGHELVHVSQISSLANISSSIFPSSIGEMMEFSGYQFEAFLGRNITSNSFQNSLNGWMASPTLSEWFKRVHFMNFSWIFESKYKYVWP